MLAIGFTFTANRYHATQWGRHANEDTPEWPPSPWRILRGIVATWRRTLPDLAPERVVPILEAMASELPKFRLPAASRGHARHYMPLHESVRERTTLGMDSFVAIRPGAPVFAIWPNVELTPRQQEDLNSILHNLTYLGRAESWVEASLVADCPGEMNSLPLETGAVPEGDWEIVRVLTPRTPLSLRDLEMETSDLRRHGVADPEGTQWWTYVRRRDCFGGYCRHAPRMPDLAEGAQVVRFALAGTALPMAFDTLRWGELARRSAMSQYGRKNNGEVSQALSGKDSSETPLKGHEHAFYLPTDEDGDGRLDHLTILTPGGLTAGELQAVVSIDTLNPGSHSEPLQLAYQSHGAYSDFIGVSPLFGSAKAWRSLTPYILPRHVKLRGPRDTNGRREMVDSPPEQVAREFSLRWPAGPSLIRVSVQDLKKRIAPMRRGQSAGFMPFDYFTRKRGGGSNGCGVFNFEIEFDSPVSGPLALGFACHQGLGVFVPADD